MKFYNDSIEVSCSEVISTTSKLSVSVHTDRNWESQVRSVLTPAVFASVRPPERVWSPTILYYK